MTHKLKLKNHPLSNNGIHYTKTLTFHRIGDDEINIYIEHTHASIGYRLTREQKRQVLEFLKEE